MSRTGLLISQFKMLDLKKMMVKHSYFMTALLTYAMNKTELRTKQRFRRTRWMELRANFVKDTSYGSCREFNIEEEE
ncbi:hypothetical protein HN011_008941 [Eciton burchellii]|nr:hypothetical protein HN011_008941 [Eciton burchellii]